MGLRWLWCRACQRVHRVDAPHLTIAQKAEASDFPCAWFGGPPFSIPEPYLVIECASLEALVVAEEHSKRIVLDSMRRRFAEG